MTDDRRATDSPLVRLTGAESINNVPATPWPVARALNWLAGSNLGFDDRLVLLTVYSHAALGTFTGNGYSGLTFEQVSALTGLTTSAVQAGIAWMMTGDDPLVVVQRAPGGSGPVRIRVPETAFEALP